MEICGRGLRSARASEVGALPVIIPEPVQGCSGVAFALGHAGSVRGDDDLAAAPRSASSDRRRPSATSCKRRSITRSRIESRALAEFECGLRERVSTTSKPSPLGEQQPEPVAYPRDSPVDRLQ